MQEKGNTVVTDLSSAYLRRCVGHLSFSNANLVGRRTTCGALFVNMPIPLPIRHRSPIIN